MSHTASYTRRTNCWNTLGKYNHSRNKWETKCCYIPQYIVQDYAWLSLSKHKDPEQEKAQIIKKAAQLIKSDVHAILKWHQSRLRLIHSWLSEDISEDCVCWERCRCQASLHRRSPMYHKCNTTFNPSFWLSPWIVMDVAVPMMKWRGISDVPPWLNMRSQKNYGPQNFLQHAPENDVHNIRTLNGKNTFNRMGIISAFRPGINVKARIKRTDVTADVIFAVGRINIHSFTSNTDNLS